MSVKKKLIIAVCAAAAAAALAAMFASQSTPSNVLNVVRAENLKVENGVLTIPASYTVVESEAVAGKTDFDTVVIEGEAEIGYHAFYGCPNLRTVELKSACEIGEGAFADCPELKKIIVHSGGGSCAEDAFAGHGGASVYCRENSPVWETARRNDMHLICME